ncbi:MAG: GGDEF domain-containing protein, partial [Candidatus Krumholzibacteria bacterium]|nr:GGDEF domain-containing protein [Candidatus Krumholzibacteria bacterium]
MDRLRKTSRYFLEHLVPWDLIPESKRRHLHALLHEDDEDAIALAALDLAEDLASRGHFERLGPLQYRDPRSNSVFRFPAYARTAPASQEGSESARLLQAPEPEDLEAIYEEILSALRLEEARGGGIGEKNRLMLLLDSWIPGAAVTLYGFQELRGLEQALGMEIVRLEVETLAQGHPFREVMRLQAPLKLDSRDPSFRSYPRRAEGSKETVFLLPLFLEGQAWGILELLFPGEPSLPGLEGRLQMLGRALSHQIYNHRVLSRVVFVDWLTQVYNRTFLEMQFPIEVEKARRNGETLALLMIDLDDFKRVNDTWGHDWGDRVLRDFASVLRKTFRRVDSIFRFGGEEFMVILPRLDRERAFRAG